MERETQLKLAALLRAAAAQAVSEDHFWLQLKNLIGSTEDPLAAVAHEASTHYWGNFHERSILFLIPRKPDPNQLQQGKNELNVIAEALEKNWPLQELEQMLKDI